MKAYEGVFIFSPETAGETRKQLDGQVEELIKKNHGTVTQKTDWGKRVLGYPVKKHREGQILVVDFQTDPAQMADLRRAFELHEGILKFTLTIKNTRTPKIKNKTPVQEPSRPAPVSR